MFCSIIIDNFKKIHVFRTQIVNIQTGSAKRQVPVGKNITETGEGFLYLTSNESGRCLIRGSIESARILEQTNMTFTVSDRKSRLCTGKLSRILQDYTWQYINVTGILFSKIVVLWAGLVGVSGRNLLNILLKYDMCFLL